MQDFLQGTDGFRYIETDRTGKELVPYRGQERAARDGCDVKLTIDLSLQNILEAELDAACAEFKPKDASAIMIRPQTGEILAMASRPTFDPNKPGEAPAGAGEKSFDCGHGRTWLDFQDRYYFCCARRETCYARYDGVL